MIAPTRIPVPPSAASRVKSAETHERELDLVVAAQAYATCLRLAETKPSVTNEQLLRHAAHVRGFASQQYLDSLFRDIRDRLEHPS
jgi:predicted TPR repeat methyltransferase